MYENTAAMGAASQVLTIGQPIALLSPSVVQQRLAQQQTEDPSVHAEEADLREDDESELFMSDGVPWYVWGLGGAAAVGVAAFSVWWFAYRKSEEV